MKKIFAAIVAILSFNLASAQNQITVSGAIGGNGNYSTIKDAFNAINATVQSSANIVVTINESVTETTSDTLKAGAWTSLTIKPAVGTTPTVSGDIAGPLVCLFGAQNVTIDGSNSGTTSRDLTIENSKVATNTGVSAILLGNGASYNTLKNCVIKGSSTSATANAVIMLYSTASFSAPNNSNTISNNQITKSGSNSPRNAVLNTGAYTTQSHPNSSNVFTNNSISDFSESAFRSLGNSNGNTYSKNQITIPSATTSLRGFWFNESSSGHFISNENITGNSISLTSSGSNIYGIYLQRYSSTIFVTNNFIVLNGTSSTVYGIYDSYASDTDLPIAKIYYNSVLMNGSGTLSAAYRKNKDTYTELRNNNFINKRTGSTNYVMFLNGSITNFSSNYNNLFKSETNNFAFYVIAINDFTTYKNAYEPNSINVDAPFASSSDLHIPDGSVTAINGAGTPVSVTTDIDDQARNASIPDIGADEFTSLIPQIITFGSLPSKSYGDAPFTVSATGGASGNPVVFTSSDPTIATCTGTNGSTITILKAGSCTIFANQAGNTDYSAAAEVGQTLTISKINQTITFNALTQKAVGDPSFQLNATASSGLTVSYASSNTSVASVSGNIVTINGAGSTTITASQSGNENYNAATPVDQVLVVTSSAQTWTGAVSTSWSTPGNWDSNLIPNSSTNVIIPNTTNKPVIADSPLTPATCNNLTINSGATLAINAGAALTISGNTTNNGTLHLKADAYNNSSLISNTNITAKVEVSVPRSDDPNSPKKILISTPVLGQSFESFVSVESGNDISYDSGPTVYGLKDYNETLNKWNSYFDYSNIGTYGSFSTGKGYTVIRIASPSIFQTNDNAYVTFNGSIQNGTIDVPVTRNGGGWNCVGNPYTSQIALNVNADATNNFFSVNSSNLDPSYTIYFWDANADPYSFNAISNSDDATYAPVGAGFFVRAKSGATQVQFTDAMRSHKPDATFRAASTDWSGFKLVTTTPAGKVSTSLKFNPNMTKGLDVTYDAGFLRYSNDLAIYTKLVKDNGVNFAVQCLPDNISYTEAMIVPVGFDLTAGGNVTFSTASFNLPSTLIALLEDRSTGNFTNLNNETVTYSTTVPANTSGIGRFYLHLLNKTYTDINAYSSNSVSLYASGKSIFVSGQVSAKATLSVSDIRGVLVGNYGLNGSNSVSLKGLSKGVYIVTLKDGGVTKTQKVVLQ